MRAMLQHIMVICRKEWRVLMDTPLAYVIGIAFLIASGFFFASNLFLVGQADMRAWFSVLALLLMFFAPAMAMRMLAEEKRSGTFELLATMPVQSIAIVLGKYIALCLQLMALLGLTLFYPISLSWLGNVDVGQIAASYMAALLLLCAYAAVCLYASAISRYEVVAYILGFSMLLSLFVLAKAVAIFSPSIQNWIILLSPLAHYESMLRGMIRLHDIVFFIAMISIFLSLTWFELQRRRWR